jgi:alpha-methylacyl-CoA racemase
MTPLLGHFPGPGEDLLSGVLPCYNLYRTRDGRALAVGSLEFKFWRAACEVFERPDWVNQHWQRGQMPHSRESVVLREAVADLVATRSMADWAARFEQADACVTPVLTLQEAQAHPIFAAQGGQAWTAVD